MTMCSNQKIFEEFQRSVDQAHAMALKLAPEHFHLAYNRCAKLQKIIFKRACGYCSSSETLLESKDIKTKVQMTATPLSLYLNLPTQSLCNPVSVTTSPSTTDIPDSLKEVLVDRILLLRQTEDSVPRPISVIDTDSHSLPTEPSAQTAHQIASESVLSPQEPSEPTADSAQDDTLFQRDTKSPTELKIESSASPLSFTQSCSSSPSGHINIFMTEEAALVTMAMGATIGDNKPPGSDTYPDARFSPMDTEPSAAANYRAKYQRKYNWSVVLSKLHEKMPVSLPQEVLPYPHNCHELHVIPPTAQKLRPTKRCQLCLKGYRSRKESRYFCKACDKGFHIKCFDLYHDKVGCKNFKIRIIGADQ